MAKRMSNLPWGSPEAQPVAPKPSVQAKPDQAKNNLPATPKGMSKEVKQPTAVSVPVSAPAPAPTPAPASAPVPSAASSSGYGSYRAFRIIFCIVIMAAMYIAYSFADNQESTSSQPSSQSSPESYSSKTVATTTPTDTSGSADADTDVDADTKSSSTADTADYPVTVLVVGTDGAPHAGIYKVEFNASDDTMQSKDIAVYKTYPSMEYIHGSPTSKQKVWGSWRTYDTFTDNEVIVYSMGGQMTVTFTPVDELPVTTPTTEVKEDSGYLLVGTDVASGRYSVESRIYSDKGVEIKRTHTPRMYGADDGHESVWVTEGKTTEIDLVDGEYVEFPYGVTVTYEGAA